MDSLSFIKYGGKQGFGELKSGDENSTWRLVLPFFFWREGCYLGAIQKLHHYVRGEVV